MLARHEEGLGPEKPDPFGTVADRERDILLIPRVGHDSDLSAIGGYYWFLFDLNGRMLGMLAFFDRAFVFLHRLRIRVDKRLALRAVDDDVCPRVRKIQALRTAAYAGDPSSRVSSAA